jgi:hypothetical protein
MPDLHTHTDTSHAVPEDAFGDDVTSNILSRLCVHALLSTGEQLPTRSTMHV